MNTLAKLQVWTTPLWLVMMVLPFLYLLITHPDAIGDFLAYSGGTDAKGGQGVSFAGTMLAAGVCLSLIAQIAEQIDYLRFMPPRRRRTAASGGPRSSPPVRAGSSSAPSSRSSACSSRST